MSHCGPEETAVNLAEIDVAQKEAAFEAAESALDAAELELEACELEHA